MLLKISTKSKFENKVAEISSKNASFSTMVIVNLKTRDVKIFIQQKDVFYQIAQTVIVQRDTKSCVDTRTVVNFKRITAVNMYTKQWSILTMRMRMIYLKIKPNNLTLSHLSHRAANHLWTNCILNQASSIRTREAE